MHLPKFIISGLTAFSLFAAGCNANTNAPTKVSVSKTLNVSISQTQENGDSIFSIPPILLEEAVQVSELVYYPEDGNMITVPFNFSDTTKYAAIIEANLDKRIAISVNGKVVSKPVVKTKLTNGACSILLTEEQTKQLFPDADITQLFND